HEERIAGNTFFDSTTLKKMGIETLLEFHIRRLKEIEAKKRAKNMDVQDNVGEMEGEEKNLSHTMEIQDFNDVVVQDEGGSRPRRVTYEEFDSLSSSMATLTTSVPGLHTKLDKMMVFLWLMMHSLTWASRGSWTISHN
ncbi:unnamed protein product, partial [Ilex paraguariensis]